MKVMAPAQATLVSALAGDSARAIIITKTTKIRIIAVWSIFIFVPPTVLILTDKRLGGELRTL